MSHTHRPRSFPLVFAGLGLALCLLLAGCTQQPPASVAPAFEPEILPLPKQLSSYEEMQIPADNPMTPEKVALGRQLFFDKRLSVDGTRSCYSCHLCEKGLTDGLPKAVGSLNKQLPRSSPSLWNIGYHKEFYWDGRSGSLEKQGMAAWTGGNMGAKADEIAAKLNGIAGYKSQFQKCLAAMPRQTTLSKRSVRLSEPSSAATQRTIAGRLAINLRSVTKPSAARKLFKDLKCTNCHDGVLFTDQQYHNVGIGMDAKEPDVGRFKVSSKPQDTGAFKTPTLRDISKSAPYFHDGSTATLEETVDLMLGGGKPNKYLDKKNLQKRKVTPQQKQELLAFLKTLDVSCTLSEPKLP